MWTPEKYSMQVTLGLSEGGWKGHFKVWQFLPGKCHVSSGAGCHLTFNRSGSSGGFGSNCLMLLRKCWQEPCSLVTAWPRSQGVAGGARKDARTVNHPRPATCPARRVQWEERASRTSTCRKRHDAEADVGPMGGLPGQGAGPEELGRGGSWRSVWVLLPGSRGAPAASRSRSLRPAWCRLPR